MRLGYVVSLLAAFALSGAQPHAVSAGEVRIALAAPLTGPMSARGLAMQDALEAAVQEMNASGGVLGQRLVLDIEDDNCQRAAAEGAARAIVARSARLVIGHPCSAAAVAARSIYGEADVLLIAAGARHPDVTRAPVSLPLLRLAGRDDQQGAAAARWLVQHAPQRRMAIVQDRTAYARALSEQAVAALKEAGFDAVTVLPIVASKHAYTDTIARLREANAEAIFFAGYPEEAGIVLAGLDEAKLATAFLGADALATPEFASLAVRRDRIVNVLLPTDPVPSAEGGAAWIGANTLALLARGALEVWREGAERAGSLAGSAVAGKLVSTQTGIPTPTLGVVHFSPSGDIAGDAFQPASARAGEWVLDRSGRTP